MRLAAEIVTPTMVVLLTLLSVAHAQDGAPPNSWAMRIGLANGAEAKQSWLRNLAR